MASGRFKLYYNDALSRHPGAGIHYRLVDEESGRHFFHGTTNAAGETQSVEATHQPASFRLEVLNLHTGQYEAPDLDGIVGTSVKPEMNLPGDPSHEQVTQAVRIKPYFRVRFHTQTGNKPIVGAKFTAWQRDAHGREVMARDLDKAAPISGTTNAQGETGILFCAAPLVFKFEIPGSTVRVSTPVLMPLIKGCRITRYDQPFKTVAASTVPLKQDAVAQLSGKASLPVLISPQDGELIAVPQSAFDEFEEVSGVLEQVMANGHRAKLDLSRALESGKASEVEAAEKALGLAEDKIKSELNKNFSKLSDLKEVVTVESIAKGRNATTGGQQMGLRRRYLSQDKYLQLKAKRLNQTDYKLNLKFSQGPVTGSATAAPKTLDAQALKESFKKIKSELKSSHELFKRDPVVLSLFDAASTQFSDTIVKSETYEVEAHAQWMRLVAGAGASSEFDWKAKKAQIQGNLQAKVVLCEGKTVARYAFPSLKGWMMRFCDEDLGAIRAVVNCELYGFAGAKFVASGAAGVSWQGLKQVVVGVPKNPKATGQKLANQIDPKRRLPVFDPVSAYEAMPEDLNGIKADIDAFAGVEGGITPGGQLQWLPPMEKDFVSFAEVSATLGGSAGIGGNAKLFIYLAQGKFRVKMAAGLCLGLGAKGALEFTVNAEKLFEFVKWVSYQLLNSGVRTLVYFARQAFMALSQLVLLLIQEGVEVLDGTTTEQAKQSALYRRIDKVCSEVGDRFDEWLGQIDQAKVRHQLVQNINRKPSWLVHATPETRGMLLYQITRHGIPSHMRDAPSMSMDLDRQVHFLPAHKDAVINIMATAVTAREWENVMQHMSPRGLKSKRAAGDNEGDVIRFLNNGYSLAEALPSLMANVNQRKEVKDTGNDRLDSYLKMRNKLRNDFPKGYKVVRLDAPHLDIRLPEGRVHPGFGEIQTAEIGEAYAGDPGANLA